MPLAIPNYDPKAGYKIAFYSRQAPNKTAATTLPYRFTAGVFKEKNISNQFYLIVFFSF